MQYDLGIYTYEHSVFRDARFDVYFAVNIQVVVFCVVTPCSLAVGSGVLEDGYRQN